MNEKISILEEIVNILKMGEKQTGNSKIGLEVEHIIMDDITGLAVPYYGENGMEVIMGELSSDALEIHKEDNRILELVFDKYTISLEPGGQVEFSFNPFESLDVICELYKNARQKLDEVLKNHGFHSVCQGYLPNGSVEDIDIIPKKRYLALWELFKGTGTMGKNMMRGSASIQFSIDYSSENDFVNKIRLFYLLSPIIFLITFNTIWFEGKKNKSILRRYYIWENTDGSRTGIIPGIFESDFGYKKYGEYAIDKPLYFDDGTDRSKLYLAQIYPFVRAKGNCIEVRFADSIPLKYCMAYLAVCKCIIDSEGLTKRILENLPDNEQAILEAYDSIDNNGYRADIYGKPVVYWINWLEDEIKKYADDIQLSYMRPIKELIDCKKFIFQKEGE